jgi:hypothetical protein
MTWTHYRFSPGSSSAQGAEAELLAGLNKLSPEQAQTVLAALYHDDGGSGASYPVLIYNDSPGTGANARGVPLEWTHVQYNFAKGYDATLGAVCDLLNGKPTQLSGETVTLTSSQASLAECVVYYPPMTPSAHLVVYYPKVVLPAPVYQNSGPIDLGPEKSVPVPNIDLHATDFTIATKVNVSSTAHRSVVFSNWGKGSWQLFFAIAAGGAPTIDLRKDMPTSGSDPEQDLCGLVGNAVVSAGAWAHVAVTFTWGADRHTPTCKLYLDGRVVGSVSPPIDTSPKVRNPYNLMPSSYPYLIGTAQGEWFYGQMAGFRVYTVALSDEEIARLAT